MRIGGIRNIELQCIRRYGKMDKKAIETLSVKAAVSYAPKRRFR